MNFHRWTDKTFPPRFRSMIPRLQAKIPKMFGWEMASGHDLYLWLDGTFILWRFGTVRWFVEQLGQADFAIFAHPSRETIRDEARMLREALAIWDPYICSRYEREFLDEQMGAIPTDYPDDRLYAAGAFIYRDLPKTRAALTDWWVHTSRYHTDDQLSLPYVLWKHKVAVKVLPGFFYDHNGACLFRAKGARIA